MASKWKKTAALKLTQNGVLCVSIFYSYLLIYRWSCIDPISTKIIRCIGDHMGLTMTTKER